MARTSPTASTRRLLVIPRWELISAPESASGSVANSVERLALAHRLFHELVCGLIVEEGRHARGRGHVPHVSAAHRQKFFQVRDVKRLLFAEHVSHQRDLGKML